MTTYECKECKAPVTVSNGIVRKSCGCEAAVIANLRAVCSGKSSVAGDNK